MLSPRIFFLFSCKKLVTEKMGHYVEDRDINAALNILQKGLSTQGHWESLKLREFDPLAGLEQSCSVKIGL